MRSSTIVFVARGRLPELSSCTRAAVRGRPRPTTNGMFDEAGAGSGEPSGQGGPTPDDRATSLLLAEYGFVSGLIPFYRRVEILALGGTGATIAALLAFVGGLEAAEDPNRRLQATLLSLAALVPLVLLLLELMALTRIMRASAYIRTDLYPLAKELTGREQILRWEFSPTRTLIESLPGFRRRASATFAKFFASSAPIVTAIMSAAVGLPVAGLAIDPSEPFALDRLIGFAAAAIAIAAGGYTLLFTIQFEARAPAQHQGHTSAGDAAMGRDRVDDS